MLTISHPSEDTFRLEIHASPSELDPASRRQLHGVLRGLARALEEQGSEKPDGRPESRPKSRPRRTRERSGEADRC